MPIGELIRDSVSDFQQLCEFRNTIIVLKGRFDHDSNTATRLCEQQSRYIHGLRILKEHGATHVFYAQETA